MKNSYQLLKASMEMEADMDVRELLNILLEEEEPPSARSLIEAAVYLPARGHRWVATFRDANGRQAWRSTRLVDRSAALALAKEWESQERRKRALQGLQRPKLRVRRGSRERALGLPTQREVAAVLGLSERAVRDIEKRALEKLRRHPALQKLWQGYLRGDIDEQLAPIEPLNQEEIYSLFRLTRNDFEWQVLTKLLLMVLR